MSEKGGRVLQRERRIRSLILPEVLDRQGGVECVSVYMCGLTHLHFGLLRGSNGHQYLHHCHSFLFL